MRVLITGFGPFPGVPFNPSARLAAALTGRHRPAFASIERTTHVFATTYAGVDRDLPPLVAQKPDIVLMFGLAGRARELRIETRARNAASLLFPDAIGRRPRQRTIARDKPAALRGGAPFTRVLGAARDGRVPVRLSRDAGTYLCNYAYWRALERAGGDVLVQFVHIPPLRPKRKRRRGGDDRLTFPQLVAAAERLLIALIAARRR